MTSGFTERDRLLKKMNKKNSIIFIFCYLVFLPYCTCCFSSQNILDDIQKEVTKLVEIAKPSVVTISSKSSHSYLINKDNRFLSFFRENKEERTVFYNSICSGFIYNDQGYIITKSDNISEYEKVNVILYDGTQYNAIYIGQDQETNITVLKIEAENLYPAKLGDSDKVTIGSWATIIGNSMGVSQSISFGLVNSILTSGLIQLSAIVSPGNSGSPVFDCNGQVIGILAAQVDVVKKINESHDKNLFTEVGLAFPINKTRSIADDIINSYNEQLGWIGIQLKYNSLKSNNLELTNVISNSPAAKAGLRKGDNLIKFNNTTLANPQQLGELIRNTNPGYTVPISFMRYNTRLNVFVTVGKKMQFTKRKVVAKAVEYKGYYWQAFQSTRIDTNSYNKSRLQNKVKRLEQEIFQLKTILNRQKVK